MSTSQENTTSDIINNLTPGAQYRVVVYHTNGPLVSPPSEPVIIDIGGLSIYIVLVSFILIWLPFFPSRGVHSCQSCRLPSVHRVIGLSDFWSAFSCNLCVLIG